jgi:hypothetical protein
MDETDVNELIQLYNSEDANDPDGGNTARGIAIVATLIGALAVLLYAGLRLALARP